MDTNTYNKTNTSDPNTNEKIQEHITKTQNSINPSKRLPMKRNHKIPINHTKALQDTQTSSSHKFAKAIAKIIPPQNNQFGTY